MASRLSQRRDSKDVRKTASFDARTDRNYEPSAETLTSTPSRVGSTERKGITGRFNVNKPKSTRGRPSAASTSAANKSLQQFENNNKIWPSTGMEVKKGSNGTRKAMISPRLQKSQADLSSPSARIRPQVRPKTELVPLATRKVRTAAKPSFIGANTTYEKSDITSKNKATARPRQENQVSKFGQKNVVSSQAISPKNYTVKPIIPAQKAELIDVARAMHRTQFARRVKKLFDPEREAAIQAIESGVYIGWRCLGNDFDCIRVSTNSKCFCGHLQHEHESFSERNRQILKCHFCPCKQFAFIPSRPEEIGEWWLQKRPGFDVRAWRAKCRCKHTHEEHDPNANRKCRIRGCPCFAFDSNFLCAACDKHWEQHETCFDDTASRQMKNLPYGEEYLPFHELPQLRNIVLTGNEDDDSPYNALVSGPYAVPRQKPTELALRLQGKKTS